MTSIYEILEKQAKVSKRFKQAVYPSSQFSSALDGLNKAFNKIDSICAHHYLRAEAPIKLFNEYKNFKYQFSHFNIGFKERALLSAKIVTLNKEFDSFFELKSMNLPYSMMNQTTKFDSTYFLVFEEMNDINRWLMRTADLLNFNTIEFVEQDAPFESAIDELISITDNVIDQSSVQDLNVRRQKVLDALAKVKEPSKHFFDTLMYRIHLKYPELSPQKAYLVWCLLLPLLVSFFTSFFTKNQDIVINVPINLNVALENSNEAIDNKSKRIDTTVNSCFAFESNIENAKKIGFVVKNTTVEIIGQKKEWLFVECMMSSIDADSKNYESYLKRGWIRKQSIEKVFDTLTRRN